MIFRFTQKKYAEYAHNIAWNLRIFTAQFAMQCRHGICVKMRNFPVHFLAQENTINEKGIEFCHKLKFSNPYICASEWFIPLIFQTKCVPLSSRLFSPLPN